jgi:hypothetical protein
MGGLALASRRPQAHDLFERIRSRASRKVARRPGHVRRPPCHEGKPEMERQFVVQLDNRPGELAHLARALAARGINITQVSCAGTGSIAYALLATAEPEETRAVLRGLGHEFLEGATVVVPLPDHAGALATVAERLARAGVNILGTLIVGRRAGIVEVAFAVDDQAKARIALEETEAVPA